MPSARSSAIEPVGMRLDFDMRAVLAQLHDRALAEAPLDLRHGQVERFLTLGGGRPVHRGEGAVVTTCRHALLLFASCLPFH